VRNALAEDRAENSANTARKHGNGANDVAERLGRAATKAERRAAFARARKAAYTIVDAARIAGISRRTATDWEKHMRNCETGNVSQAMLTKAKLEQIYSDSIQAGVDAGDWRVAQQLGPPLAAMQGWNAPTRSEIVMRQIPQSGMEWLAEQTRKLGEAHTQQLEGAYAPTGSPNADANVCAQLPAQNISKNTESSKSVSNTDIKADSITSGDADDDKR
jgi:hypothetical protein